MARRTSLLSSVVPSAAAPAEPAEIEMPQPVPAERVAYEPAPKKVREATIHIGGYFPINDKLVVEFQKLKFDLRKSQQQMLYEALSDYVHKHRANIAFE